MCPIFHMYSILRKLNLIKCLIFKLCYDLRKNGTDLTHWHFVCVLLCVCLMLYMFFSFSFGVYIFFYKHTRKSYSKQLKVVVHVIRTVWFFSLSFNLQLPSCQTPSDFYGIPLTWMKCIKSASPIYKNILRFFFFNRQCWIFKNMFIF